ncbi:MAG: hypothetical protein ACT4QE_23775 [Anaerolineales bacterium]
MGAVPIIAPHASYDLIYYEREITSPSGRIMLDWVAIDVCTDAACTTAYTVFVWGDANPDFNTNIGQAGYLPPELDNQVIPLTDLAGTPPYQTGIAIDVDAVAPPGTYGWVRIRSPFGGDNDPAEIDALDVLP